MDEKCMEKGIIEHCAPTLAGMKCAGLFSYFYNDEWKVREELKAMNDLLNKKGVYIDVLIWREYSALIYVYRKSMLEKNLEKEETLELLKRYGYCNYTLESCLNLLKHRIQCAPCFPHEIGVFLGYPIEDVAGFIENEGKNCESCGIWKVYCNKQEKEKMFAKYQKCKEVYMQLFLAGRELMQLTVCSAVDKKYHEKNY